MDTEEPPFPLNPEFINRQPKWFKLVFYGCIVASILFVIALLLAPFAFRGAEKSYKTEATSNARQIGLALMEFDREYGSLPNHSTAAKVTIDYPSHSLNLTGTSSNAAFRQFLAADLTQSEQIFYARILGVSTPDGIITSGEALKKGEVGFSFISGLTSTDDPATPIVLSPLIPGTTKFDPDAFDGKAIILHIDNSVRTYDIHKDGHIYDKGIDLLSPKHPVWKGKAPDIRYPE